MSIYEKIKAIEEVKYLKYMHDFADMYKNIRDEAKKEDKSDIFKNAQYEIEILTLHAETPYIGSNSIRFIPKYELKNGTKFPDIDQFSEEQYRYYESRLEKTGSSFLKERYADFLFEHGDKFGVQNKYVLSQVLLPSLLDNASTHLVHEEYDSFLENIARAIQVSLKMRNQQFTNLIKEQLVKQLKELNESQQYDWVLEIAKLFRAIEESPLSSVIEEEDKNYCYEILEKSREYFFQNKRYEIHRHFCVELIEWSKILSKGEETIKKCLLEIGMSYELEAEHQQGREKKSSMVKAHFLERALHHYANIGEKNKIDEMKILIRQSYEDIESNGELSPISSELSIPITTINEILNPFFEVDVNEAINLISRTSTFIPKPEVIAEQTKMQMEGFPLQFLINKSIIDDGKKIIQEVEQDDSFNMSFIGNYVMRLQVGLELILVRLFDKLVGEKGLDSDILLNKIKSWELLDNKNEEFVERGIRRFFEGDYISSLHILVPQFESCIRRMFVKSGYVTTSIKKGIAQHEETFNEFLKREDIKSALGEVFHKLVQIVMVEQAGLNLRNRIAHGLITVAECKKSINILVIYLFLLLTNYRIVKNED
ncbi:DUF4209 domain-containing protein [Cytobacillus firmus]|uniref:DUF4209 domain-containing protein n=1 Tax=Cytobacillus firmus TaxID=1399 RepID=UPI0024C1FE3B|nr:DUF4209 domain-containing protein [Cytobacillus firmus]WHY63653.1 DUF4209 domain-containing protein [Cytobacillus firmus]